MRASAATDGEDSVVKLRAGSVAVTGDLVYTSTAVDPVVSGGRLTLRGLDAVCPDVPLTAGGTATVAANARPAFRRALRSGQKL